MGVVYSRRDGMGLKKGQVVELTVTDIAFGGKGLAKVDGLAVFIDLG